MIPVRAWGQPDLVTVEPQLLFVAAGGTDGFVVTVRAVPPLWSTPRSGPIPAEDRAEAALLLDKAIAGCADDEVRRGPLARQHPGPVAGRDPRPSRHRRLQRSHRGAEPVREEGEALRPWLPYLRALPPAGAAPRRRCHLAEPAPPAAHPNPLSPLKCVEPLLIGSATLGGGRERTAMVA